MSTTIVRRTGRGLVAAASIIGAAALAAPTPAQALDTGAAVGIGLGSFALGTALGAASNPYYGNPYGYGYGYAPSYSYSYAPAPYYAPAYPYYGTSYGPYYDYRWGY